MRFWAKLEEIFLSVSRSFLYLSETLLQAINLSFLDPKFSRKIFLIIFYLLINFLFSFLLGVNRRCLLTAPVGDSQGWAHFSMLWQGLQNTDSTSSTCRSLLTRRGRLPMQDATMDDFFSKTFGLKNLGLLLEFKSLVGIGRSGMMIGRLCLKMVKNAWCGAELWSNNPKS